MARTMLIGCCAADAVRRARAADLMIITPASMARLVRTVTSG